VVSSAGGRLPVGSAVRSILKARELQLAMMAATSRTSLAEPSQTAVQRALAVVAELVPVRLTPKER